MEKSKFLGTLKARAKKPLFLLVALALALAGGLAHAGESGSGRKRPSSTFSPRARGSSIGDNQHSKTSGRTPTCISSSTPRSKSLAARSSCGKPIGRLGKQLKKPKGWEALELLDESDLRSAFDYSKELRNERDVSNRLFELFRSNPQRAADCPSDLAYVLESKPSPPWEPPPLKLDDFVSDFINTFEEYPDVVRLAEQMQSQVIKGDLTRVNLAKRASRAALELRAPKVGTPGPACAGPPNHRCGRAIRRDPDLG